MGATSRLSARRIAQLDKPGRYCDGGNLWLQVRSKDAKSWIFRYVFAGKVRWHGLGDLRTISLAEARDAALECRKLLRQGIDPIEHRRAQRAAAIAERNSRRTFAEAAREYVAAHRAGWKSAQHARQWENTLRGHVLPVIGDLPVAEVTTDHVLGIIRPLWETRAETASRIRGRIELVLDYSKAKGWRSGENVAKWAGNIAHLLPHRQKVQQTKHHPSLPWRDVPALMAQLERQAGMSSLALRCLILTAGRAGEIRGARWSEINFDERMWDIPGDRMKSGKPHRVALSASAIKILREVEPIANGDPDALIFPSAKAGRPLAETAMGAVLKRMGRGDIVPHGFRASFRTWVAEATAFPPELAEFALAHALPSAVERAYQRSDMIEKRRGMMADWAAHCTGATAAPAIETEQAQTGEAA